MMDIKMVLPNWLASTLLPEDYVVVNIVCSMEVHIFLYSFIGKERFSL